MRHTIILFLALVTFWFANSGHTSALMLSLGLASIVFVLFIAHRMDVVDHESQPFQLTPRIPTYYAWLIKEIVLANIQVVKHIWLGNKSLSPVMKTVTASQKTDVGKVIYANSITLTPGTVTVKLEDDQFTVHALLQESFKDLESGAMDRQVTKLENL